MFNKHQQVTATIDKLKKIAKDALVKGKYNRAMAAINAGCGILYNWNQYYVDEDFELFAKQVGEQLVKPKIGKWEKQRRKVVLYYDSFGLDTRGLALTYLKALVHIGYKLIYVTDERGRNTQPDIHKATDGYDITWVYVEGRDYVKQLEQIQIVFEQYHPTDAFFYTTPNDVSATAVFDAYEGLVIRYQVNLTDHGFWLGKYAFDYSLDGRQMGANIDVNYRGLNPEQIMPMCSYYQNVDYSIPFEGFPFDASNKIVVFSGGALYKTLGDSNNLYYKILDHILVNNPNAVFLYAGAGDDTELRKIMSKYPNRVYHIPERKDFYQIIERSALYLNTYPMFGGSMMRYAAMAGVVPLTLKHDHDADGLLMNQENINVEFDTMEEVCAEADRLLSDAQYRQKQSVVMKNATTSEKDFERNMKLMLDEHRTEYAVSHDYMDTSEFRKNYVDRFVPDMLYGPIAALANKDLLWDFPGCFVSKTFNKIRHKFGGR